MATDTGWRPPPPKRKGGLTHALRRVRSAPSPAAQRQGNNPSTRRARARIVAQQQPPTHRQVAQHRNARVIVKEGRKLRATRKQKVAALSTAMVESNLRNVHYGDRDSLGLFQQRPSQGWGSPAQLSRPRYAARKFYVAAKQVDRPGLAPGDLAQAVQRSAYPRRYAKKVPTAKQLLARIERR